ncbi:MAG: hypothetical protein ABIK28_22200, partial [Planctomycetota bacterium]
NFLILLSSPSFALWDSARRARLFLGALVTVQARFWWGFGDACVFLSGADDAWVCLFQLIRILNPAERFWSKRSLFCGQI